MKNGFELFYKTKNIKKLVFINESLEKLFSSFLEMFQIVEAAGGLVQNDKNEFLMIFRKGFWDLPKGKLDAGENLEECAVREVEEECGITNIIRKDKICVTYHIYGKKNNLNIKPSHWYHMKVEGCPNLIPQTDEDIEQAKLVNLETATKLLENAYPSIKQVFKNFSF